MIETRCLKNIVIFFTKSLKVCAVKKNYHQIPQTLISLDTKFHLNQTILNLFEQHLTKKGISGPKQDE